MSEVTLPVVFVFGSNGDGFHGAGGAGMAMRGDGKNTWRSDPAFLRAMKAPVGHPDRVGRLAVFGQARGLQRGREGHSYAIQTVTKPGRRRSIPLSEIQSQLEELWDHAAKYSGKAVYQMTPIGTGYAGYTLAEMRKVVVAIVAKKGDPGNILGLDTVYLQENIDGS